MNQSLLGRRFVLNPTFLIPTVATPVSYWAYWLSFYNFGLSSQNGGGHNFQLGRQHLLMQFFQEVGE